MHGLARGGAFAPGFVLGQIGLPRPMLRGLRRLRFLVEQQRDLQEAAAT